MLTFRQHFRLQNVNTSVDRLYTAQTSGVDRRGNATAYDYFGAGPAGFEYVRDNVKTVARPGGAVTEVLNYVSFNLPESVKDPEGHTTSMTYDGAGNIETRTLPAIHVLDAVTYAPAGFDTIGSVAKSFKTATEKWTYLPNGRGQVHTYAAPETDDASGPTTEFFYDIATGDDFDTGLSTGTKLPDHSERSRVSYDRRGHTVKSRAPELLPTSYVRDGLGRVTHAIEPPSGGVSAPTTVTVYDRDSNVESVKLPNGALTEYTHDLLGRRTVVFDFGVSPSRIAETFYDIRGFVRRDEDFKSAGVETLRNEMGWPTQVKARDGSRVVRTYDPNGNVKTLNELGDGDADRLTSFEYDERDNPTRTTHADPTLVTEVRFNKDDLAVVTGTLKDGLLTGGAATLFNARHLAFCTIEIDPGPAGGADLLSIAEQWATGASTSTPPGPKTCVYFDARLNARAVEDDLHHVTQQSYDGADRPDESIDARGFCVLKRTYTEFDAVDELLVPDPLTGGTSLMMTRKNFHTARGETAKTIDALGASVRVERNANGWRTDFFDQDEVRTQLVLNGRGWVLERRVHVNADGLGIVTTGYAQDANGNVETVTDPRGKLYQMVRDAEDRVTNFTTPSGCERTWTYNAFSEVRTYEDANGEVATYGRNALGLVTNETYEFAGSVTADIAIGYEDGTIL